MAKRQKREPKGRLPKDWVDASPGLWMTTEALLARFEDGAEEIISEGAVVTLDYPQEIYETRLPGPEYEVDESVPYTNWYDNSRSFMTFRGKLDGRQFEFVEPINAGNGGPFGLSNGMHYVRVGPLKPLSFPEYLPDGVSMPSFWDSEKATRETMFIGGPSGFWLDHAIGKRWLPCFKIDINDTYYGYVSIDAPSLKTEHYWGRKDDKSPKGSVPRKTVADFLAAADTLIFRADPHATYPKHGKSSVRFPVAELPAEWLDQILYQERYDTDDEFRKEHYRREEEKLREDAFLKYRKLTLEETLDALHGGAFIEKEKFQRGDNHFDSVEVFAVMGEDIFKFSGLRDDRPSAPYVIGIVPDEVIDLHVQQAREHFNGLRDDAILRIKRPNRRDEYVIASDPRAEQAPYINARNLIKWTLEGSGDNGHDDEWADWRGRTLFGGNWGMSVSRRKDGEWWGNHSRSRGRYGPECDETDIHNYDNWGVRLEASSMEEAFRKAQDVAFAEEVSHLIGGGWYAAKAGAGDFSTDLLEPAALFEARELGYTGDRSRMRYQPLPHRLAAIVWELKRRGSKVGWDMIDDSLGADLEAEIEEDGY